MRHWGLILLLVLGGALLCAGAAWAEDELVPVPAAVAEARVAEERDFLTDLLWVSIDTYWHEGKWEDCVRLNREIIALDPQFVEAYTSAAWLLWSYDEDKQAEELYEQGIAANPDSPDLYFSFGFYYRNRKKFDPAIAMFRKAVEKGTSQINQHMLPNTLEEAGRKREALTEWKQLLKRFPTDSVAQMRIAKLEKELAK